MFIIGITFEFVTIFIIAVDLFIINFIIKNSFNLNSIVEYSSIIVVKVFNINSNFVAYLIFIIIGNLFTVIISEPITTVIIIFDKTIIFEVNLLLLH